LDKIFSEYFSHDFSFPSYSFLRITFLRITTCIMRIIFPISLCSIIVVQSTAPQDPCWLVCDEYSAALHGKGLDLCGASASHCDESTNTCTFLYWSRTEVGQEGLISSEVESDLTEEELASPLTCTRAREMVTHRLQEPTRQPTPQRRVIPISSSIQPVRVAPAHYPGIRGLTNIGNVCYFNTALQIFAHMRPVRQLLGNLQMFAQFGALDIEAEMPYQHQANVQYLRTLVGLHAGMTEYAAGSDPQNPATILQNLVALGYHQFANVGVPGDMQEALGGIFEATSGALQALQGPPAPGQLNAIRQIFSMDVRIRNSCFVCDSTIRSPQTTNELYVNIQPEPHRAGLSLVDGLHMAFGAGVAQGVVCPHCQIDGIATRQLVNTRDIFVAQILRVDQTTQQRINTRITFPSGDADLLDLTPFIAPGSPSLANPLYRLVAISHHNGGHYFADINHEGTWYRVDDGIVYPLASAPTGPSITATMLFYERVPATAPVAAAAGRS